MARNAQVPASESSLPVAVDTMGGDRGLAVQVEGAVQAYKEFGVRSLLVGPKTELTAKLQALGGASMPIEVRDAPQTIGMEESPTRAVRRKPDSSLCVAHQLVAQGEASSVISAGNSGAMMAAGILIGRLMPGIERPAIATLIPAAGHAAPNIILDVGANVDCHAHNLVQFAIMGAIYYNSLFEDITPRVALLSNGAEASKGTDIIRAAALVLSESEAINYVGYVEGRDVAGDIANVIVCDGFVGNVVLKAMEGCVRLISDQIRHESKKGVTRRVGAALSRDIFREVFLEKFDYTAHGGSPLLGLKSLAIVLHGSSDSRAVKNAVRVADTFARSGMNKKISAELTKLEEQSLEPLDDIFSNVMTRKNGTRAQQVTGSDEASHGEVVVDDSTADSTKN